MIIDGEPLDRRACLFPINFHFSLMDRNQRFPPIFYLMRSGEFVPSQEKLGVWNCSESKVGQKSQFCEFLSTHQIKHIGNAQQIQ